MRKIFLQKEVEQPSHDSNGDTINMKKSLVGAVLILIFSACHKTPSHLDKGNWGLRKLDKVYHLPIDDTPILVCEKFVPQFSSDKYEVRLYFPNLEQVRVDSIFNMQKHQIINLLDGMKFTLTDLTSGEELARLDLTKENFFSYISFNRNPDKPLSCWISPQLNLRKKHKYKMGLIIPTESKNQKESLDIVLIVGVGRFPSL
ncbi:MAG: hypothetical protein ACRBG0_16670 [Lewinella sp.]|uniref:hypothetical protein n=1 Tax=Lewinella sp. TaxID=2004506 RepID=UPI003D6BB360